MMTRRTFIKSLSIASAVALVGGSAYAYQSSKVEVSRERLVFPYLNKKLRVVAVSDLHLPCLYNAIEDLAELINGKSPDLFVLAGDTIDKRGNESLVEFLDGVKARFCKVATLGNWEYLGKLNLELLKREYKKSGISLLVNDICELDDLTILGLDDLVEGAPDYELLDRASTVERPLLVICHCPASFDRIVQLSRFPAIVLSGHTHGGQIAPFGIVVHTPEGSGPYVQGWYHKGKHSMYVTRGIGTTPGLPLRIGASPELLVLDLLPA